MFFINDEIIKVEEMYDKDEFGSISSYYSDVKTYKVNIQPISVDKIRKEYGIETSIAYQVFMSNTDGVELKNNNMIRYKDDIYFVQGYTDWSNGILPYISFNIVIYK